MKLRTGVTSPTLGNSPVRQASRLLLNLSDDDDDDLMEQLQLILQQLTAGKLVQHDNLLNQLNQLNLLNLLYQLNLLHPINLVNVDLRRMRMILMSLFYSTEVIVSSPMIVMYQLSMKSA